MQATGGVDFEVVLTLLDPPVQLRPDLSATADIIVDRRLEVPAVPIISVTVQANPSADPGGAGDRFEQESARGPIARSLDLVGDRWTILVLRDLRLGRTRFADLLRSLEGISPNLLSARLKTLEREGLVARRLYNEHPPRAEYVLTEHGEAFGTVLKAMYDWGSACRPAAAVS